MGHKDIIKVDGEIGIDLNVLGFIDPSVTIDVIENETLTCYNGIPGAGCGKCPACKLRNAGLREFEKRQRTTKAKRATSRPRA